MGFLLLFIFRQQAYKKFSKTYPTQYEAQDDVTSLILCLFIVLGLFSIQYSPGPPLQLTNNMLHYDQQIQYTIFLGALCNILANNMQYSDQQL